jgi:hypothetical protein
MRWLQPPKRESRPGHWAASFVFGAGRFARPGLSILRASVRVRPAPATIPRPASRDNHRSNFNVTDLSETIPPVNTDVPLDIPVFPPPRRRPIPRKRRRVSRARRGPRSVAPFCTNEMHFQRTAQGASRRCRASAGGRWGDEIRKGATASHPHIA